MRRILDYDIKGKKVLVRVDFNCAVENGKIVPGDRIEAHSKTIKRIAEKGARVIVLAHQGRKDSEDFLHLDQHAKLIEKYIGIPVKYIDDLTGEVARSAIGNVGNGEVIMLQNVRVRADETTENGAIVNALAPLVDYYVLDALSVAHRAHSSVVGFAKRIPAFYGGVLAEEIKALESLKDVKDVTFVLGGSKVKDSFKIMEKWLGDGKAKRFLIGGALSILMLKAKGYPIGGSERYFEEAELGEYLDDAKMVLGKFGNRIEVPVDVGLKIDEERVECDSDRIERGQIFDIGQKTIDKYRKIIAESGAVVMNGPVGVYEVKKFEKGTREVLQAIYDSKAYSLIGGGHTITAMKKLGIGKEGFGYVSLAGKALIEYLCGKELPGIKALEDNEKNFRI
jgi:phosphoglycerate kinase